MAEDIDAFNSRAGGDETGAEIEAEVDNADVVEAIGKD